MTSRRIAFSVGRRTGAVALVAAVALAASPRRLAAGDIAIHEIHYDPENKTQPHEFVELFNRSDGIVDLSGWFFSDGVRYTFDDGLELGPGEYIVVAQDPQALTVAFGLESVLGPWEGKLSNEGERVVLRNAIGEIEDSVDYGVGFPWPLATRGFGSSMELVHPDLDNDLGGSWRASGYVGGLPADRRWLVREASTDWLYRKGRTEPPADWREVDFVEDLSWLRGQTPIGFGDDDDNTVLDDMEDNYTSVYLRHEFEVDSLDDVRHVMLGLYADDGAIVTINGQEVHRFHVDDGELPFDGRSNRSTEARWQYEIFFSAADLLVVGQNVIAVHAVNQRLSNADFSIDVSLFLPSESDFEEIGLESPPTPGRRNTVFSETSSPHLRQVRHAPSRPRSGNPVVVTVKATDADGIASAELRYQVVEPGGYIRLSDPEFETDWVAVPMADDGLSPDLVAGDDVYSGRIPAAIQEHRRLVRYRVVVTDAAGLATTAPYSDDPQPNFAYFVYDGVPSWTGASRPGVTTPETYSPDVLESLPVYHLIAQASDVTNSQYVQRFEGRHFFGTLVYRGVVHDHIAFENRGEFSTYVSGKNKWRFHFHRGHRFQADNDYGRPFREPWRTLNFSGVASPWVPTNRGMAGLDEGVAFRLYELAGSPSPRTTFVHFRVIDEEIEAHPTDQYRGDLWGLYLTLEHTDGAFLDERGLPDGNLYKIESGQGDKRNQGATHPESSADYNALKAGYNSRQPLDWWRSNVDLKVYYSFRAINRAINNHDLREGWNICQYHNSETGLWSVIPWDLDMLYMPVTHWSGVMNFQNGILQNPELALEYRNRARELGDLLFTNEQFGQLVDELAALVNPPGEPLTFVDLDEAMWNWHPRTAGNHRGAFYRNPSTHSARGGTITRRLDSADHEGMVGWVKDFVLRGYGAVQLASHARDPRIPEAPEVHSLGNEGFPIDDLRFGIDEFRDPDGSGFDAVAWRVARFDDPATRGVVLAAPRHYEIVPTWESGERTTLDDLHLPVDVLQIGAWYRLRARVRDDTGRWSHWSRAIEFRAGEPTSPFSTQESLRVTELYYHPLGDDDALEFVELKNTGHAPLDLTPVAFTEGIEFRFAGSAVTELAPGEHVIVVNNLAVFERFHDVSALRVAGEYDGRLSNGGERLVLSHGPNAVILDFVYRDDWFASTDGLGASLEIRNPLAPPLGWSLETSWRASDELGGTPGRSPAGQTPPGSQRTGDLEQDGRLNISDVIGLLRHLFAGASSPLPCGDGTLADEANVSLLDSTGDEQVDTSDAVRVLVYLFLNGPAPHGGIDCRPIEGCPEACASSP